MALAQCLKPYSFSWGFLMRMEALWIARANRAEALRERRVAGWLSVCKQPLPHSTAHGAALSMPCSSAGVCTSRCAAAQYTNASATLVLLSALISSASPTLSSCFSLPLPLSYAAVLFLLAWGDIYAQWLSSKHSFFVPSSALYLTFMNSNISCNEGKQQIDRHDLFAQASHPLNPTLGGKINILSIHLLQWDRNAIWHLYQKRKRRLWFWLETLIQWVKAPT